MQRPYPQITERTLTLHNPPMHGDVHRCLDENTFLTVNQGVRA